MKFNSASNLNSICSALHGNFILIVTQVLPSADFRAVWYKSETRYPVGIAGFFLVAGAGFEPTTFRL
jgi:hypothetical protein